MMGLIRIKLQEEVRSVNTSTLEKISRLLIYQTSSETKA